MKARKQKNQAWFHHVRTRRLINHLFNTFYLKVIAQQFQKTLISWKKISRKWKNNHLIKKRTNMKINKMNHFVNFEITSIAKVTGKNIAEELQKELQLATWSTMTEENGFLENSRVRGHQASYKGASVKHLQEKKVHWKKAPCLDQPQLQSQILLRTIAHEMSLMTITLK